MGKANPSMFVGLALLILAMVAFTSVIAETCNFLPLAPCLSAARKGGPQPSQACCTSIPKLSLSCLCQGAQSSAAKSFGVDLPTALGIPQSCGLKVPKGFTCAGYKVPGG
ncbi:hypothetical protein O6H91_23G038900 [Diphasiastrum complanatum]|uniref:Uncharacterized protein n=1 Tax=Diphasiastrum complanatum TaxID=34168 RepID=A0ACC2A9S6_DIPCM|nr:hypothetical protein O6H91_23G038900 [Diphasiastrum complanatum]